MDTTTTLILVGVGVIGSHLVQHVGRMRGITGVTLVDFDFYEWANLETQEITAADPGRSKVEVQARRLQEINPELAVSSVAARVEKVPRGRLRADVMLSCLDSRRARQHVNLISRRLGTPWIDAGVEGGSRLARITTYLPGEELPCLECGWSQQDYASLEQVYACEDGEVVTPSSAAPSSLGALAASLQALELTDLLNGRLDLNSFAREVVLDAGHHKVHVTNYRRNPDCRLADHAVWTIEKLDLGPERLTLAEALSFSPDGAASSPAMGLRVEGSKFISRLSCPGCGATASFLKLEASLGSRETVCRDCDKEMVTSGFHKVERLVPAAMPELSLDEPLSTLGLRPGDLFSVGLPGNEKHMEIGGAGSA
jgi:molybdopterin/thiamine biosynthesis adenylyltransferase